MHTEGNTEKVKAILEYLENVENVNGFVKELIREKIKSLHE